MCESMGVVREHGRRVRRRLKLSCTLRLGVALSCPISREARRSRHASASAIVVAWRMVRRMLKLNCPILRDERWECECERARQHTRERGKEGKVRAYAC